MTETKKENSGLLIGIVLGIIAILILGGLIKYGIDEPKQSAKSNTHDSLINVIKAKDKYIGIVEIDLSRANDKRIKAENALKERKPIYIERVKRIVETAPDTCQTYLAALKAECDTLQAKSDSTISALKFEVAKSDTVIEAVKSKSETLEHFNDKLQVENKELTKDNKKLTKQNKRGKIVSWLIGGGLVALFLGTSLID